MTDAHATWQSMSSFAKRNGEKLQCPDVQDWLTYPHRLRPVIAVKGASTKYWLEGVWIHMFYIIYFQLIVITMVGISSAVTVDLF